MQIFNLKLSSIDIICKYGDIFTFVLLGKKTTVCLGTVGNDFVLNAKHSDVNAEEIYRGLTEPVFGSGVCYAVDHAKMLEQKKVCTGSSDTGPAYLISCSSSNLDSQQNVYVVMRHSSLSKLMHISRLRLSPRRHVALSVCLP